MATRALPIVGEGGLSRYLAEIRKFPLLDPQEEYMLAKRWREHQDTEAAHKLVTSHLRLVAKIAMGYRGYGLPINEVIAEGNIGLMQAVKRFEPERGFRLATYAMWWIRASIQEYILRSWSLVKMGTTAAQKKLFFNLRKVKGQIQAIEEKLGVPLFERRNRGLALTPAGDQLYRATAGALQSLGEAVDRLAGESERRRRDRQRLRLIGDRNADAGAVENRQRAVDAGKDREGSIGSDARHADAPVESIETRTRRRHDHLAPASVRHARRAARHLVGRRISNLRGE